MKHTILKKFQLAMHLGKLGADRRSRLVLFFLTLWLPIKKRLGFGDRVEKHVQIKKFNQVRPLFIAENLDLLTFEEIFLKDEYRAAGEQNRSPSVIFDIGSNIGLSILYFDMFFQGKARIYGFEPNPAAFERLKRNVAACPQVRVFPYAVAGEDGKISFYVHPSHLSSSLKQRMEGLAPLEVEAKAFDTLFSLTGEEHVDLVKFDVEGAEYDLFAAAKNLSRVQTLIGELHLDLFPQTKEQFVSLFSSFRCEERPISALRSVIKFDAVRHP